LSLTPGYEDEYAETIASLLVYARNTEGLQFSVAGPANEEDITYTGIHMTGPSQYVTVMHDLSTQLNNNGMSDVQFSGPDLANTSTSWLGQMMTDPVLMGKLAHFGLHSYQNMSLDSTGVYNYIQQSAYPNTHFWMTEYNVWCASCQNSGGGDNSWAFAQGTAAWLLHHLGNGASAGIVWEGYDSVYYPYNASTGGNNPGQWSYWGLFAVNDINAAVKTYTPRKGFYTLAQIANYVRPGAQRIGVSGSVPSLLTLLAFYNPNNGQITLTGVNSNSSPSTIVCALASLPAIPSLYLYYTSSTANLAYGGSVPVNNGEFSAVVPANCVYTLTYTNTGAAVVIGNGQPVAAEPYFLAPFVRNGQIFLTVVGERGRACRIETSSDLETWSELQTVALLDGTATITEPVETPPEAEALIQEKGLTPADAPVVTNEPRPAAPHFYRAILLP
jgi:O-glycosyl hydrolase